MTVTANDYLDRRRSEWRDAERAGRVHFDRVTGLVYVADAAIIALHPNGMRG